MSTEAQALYDRLMPCFDRPGLDALEGEARARGLLREMVTTSWGSRTTLGAALALRAYVLDGGGKITAADLARRPSA